MVRVFASLTCCALIAAVTSAQAQRESDSRTRTQHGGKWDQIATAEYLDARMDAWWANAKPLKTGSGEVRCLSCHTALPYMLARPLLRQARGVKTPTAHEARIVDIARQRISYAPEDQPYYDNTDDKKRESRGVEAVVNAFILTSHDAAQGGQPSAETKAAMAHLWAVQREDGAWNWLNFGLEPYEAPDAVFHGATLAALAAGSEPGKRASADGAARGGRDRLRAYLRTNYPSQRLFNKVWVLLASARVEGVLTQEQQRGVMSELDGRQRPDGGWSLNDLGPWRWNQQEAPFLAPGTPDSALLAQSDAYATGLVVYAMRQAGRSVHDPAITRAQQWLRTDQNQPKRDDPAWAPWRAHSLNHDRERGGPRGEAWRRMFMSDLATAFAALALL
jgi:hypothetical protein